MIFCARPESQSVLQSICRSNEYAMLFLRIDRIDKDGNILISRNKKSIANRSALAWFLLGTGSSCQLESIGAAKTAWTSRHATGTMRLNTHYRNPDRQLSRLRRLFATIKHALGFIAGPFLIHWLKATAMPLNFVRPVAPILR
jgi:hypothetical protein